MGLFKNNQESHEHTQFIRDLLYQYDSFLDSLEVIADFGCGDGSNIEWWAQLETRDDPPEPRNYLCYAVDKNISKIKNEVKSLPNVNIIETNLEDSRFIARSIDLLWCHNNFQYLINPIVSLRQWNEMMSVNGMLILTVPQSVHYKNNRLYNIAYNGCYYNYNIVNLMYMLAVNGFDCKDAYFYKKENDMWLYVAVYKSGIAPMNPQTTTWHDLIDLQLVNESVEHCVNTYGYVRQEEIITTWLDKDFHKIKE